MFPYKPPQLQTADETETSQQLVDSDFINLQTEFNKVNDVTTEQKQQKRLEDTVEAIIDEKNPFTNVDNNFWWEDNLFDKRDSNETVEVSKNILNDALQSSQKNIRPVDDRTIEQLIDDDFISIDNRTQQELEDNDYIELESDDGNVDIDLRAAWDPKKTTVFADYGKSKIKPSTDFNQKVRVANKIKKKYLRKKIGQRSRNKINSSTQKWLKNARYLDRSRFYKLYACSTK